jgi:hypothetical protein
MSMGIVADGEERAWDASIERVTAEVKAEFAERWNAASLLGRIMLRFQIRREIHRRMDRVCSSRNLYSNLDDT